MAKPPDAFLSYTRFDDRHGAISKFRRWLSDVVREVSGEPFEIFQDVDDIAVGERWSGKLDGTIGQVPFFVPILSPNYFRSEACRDELAAFLAAEKAKQRDDLILPIYYIECDVLENPELRASDPLAKEIRARQHYDWRRLRHNSFSTKAVKTALDQLARNIVVARRRSATPAPLVERVQALEQAAKEEFVKSLRARAEENRRLISAHLIKHVAPEHYHNTLTIFEFGTVFRDIDVPWCPEMVVIPPGEFLMGSSENDPEADADENPQHRVGIAYSLAVGRYPVTFEEYDHFAEATGRRLLDDAGWGRLRRPVINVLWDDARTYGAWLAGQTGRPYRLLSEAEWEYACRGGTTTRYWWGDDISKEKANYSGNRTSEVGSYPANHFGLHDTHGNVWEWVEDYWHSSYIGAPTDASAWLAGRDLGRVVRGGSWFDGPRSLRAACRLWFVGDNREGNLGFRVARMLASG